MKTRQQRARDRHRNSGDTESWCPDNEFDPHDYRIVMTPEGTRAKPHDRTDCRFDYCLCYGEVCTHCGRARVDQSESYDRYDSSY